MYEWNMFQANYVFMEKLCVPLWLGYDNAVVISRLGPPTRLPIVSLYTIRDTEKTLMYEFIVFDVNHAPASDYGFVESV